VLLRNCRFHVAVLYQITSNQQIRNVTRQILGELFLVCIGIDSSDCKLIWYRPYKSSILGGGGDSTLCHYVQTSCVSNPASYSVSEGRRGIFPMSKAPETSQHSPLFWHDAKKLCDLTAICHCPDGIVIKHKATLFLPPPNNFSSTADELCFITLLISHYQ